MDRARMQYLPLAIGALGAVVGLIGGVSPALFELLVLAQASLLAIVVSVTLLSVQVSSNRFAPLLTHIYREGRFDYLIRRFGVSILLGILFFLALPAVESSIVAALFAGVALGTAVWSFLALFEVEDQILTFLNPEPVLERLVEDVSFERYDAFARRHREEGYIARNPILEIVQIARTTLEGNDNYSALRAVAALERATLKLLVEYAEVAEHDGAASMHKLFDYWTQLARSAVDRGADDVLHAIVEAEASVGTLTVEEGLADAGVSATRALGRFYRAAFDADRLEAGELDGLERIAAASIQHDVGAVTREVSTEAARLGAHVSRTARPDERVSGDLLAGLVGIVGDTWAQLVAARHRPRSVDGVTGVSLHGAFETLIATAVARGDDEAVLVGCERLAAVGSEAVGGDATVAGRAAARTLARIYVATGGDCPPCLAGLADVARSGAGGAVGAALDDVRSAPLDGPFAPFERADRAGLVTALRRDTEQYTGVAIDEATPD